MSAGEDSRNARTQGAAPIRVLHLDDSAPDAELIRERLCAGDDAGWEFIHVEDRAQFEAAIARARYDLILTDYSIPGYDGLTALRLARATQPDTPVIVISGTLSEDDAVAALKAGATDYVFKQRLQRLPAAARRALEEARERSRRRDAEAAMREIAARFSELAENSRDIFWMRSADAQCLHYVSPSIQRTWGRPPEVFYVDPHAWLEAIHPDDRARVAAAFEAWTSGVAERFGEEYRVVRPDGGVRWVDDSGTRLPDASGHVRHISGVARDITDRKETERHILEGDKRFRGMFEQAAVGIVFLDIEGRRLRVNQRCCEILGYSEDELMTQIPVTHPDDRAAAAERYRVLASGEATISRGLKRYIRKDGGLIWCDITNSLVRDADERPAYILAIIQDVTERVRAQDEIRSLNASLERKVEERTRALGTETAKLRAVLDTAADAIITIDAQGAVLSFNRAAEEMLGYAASEIAGLNASRLMGDIDASVHDGFLPRYLVTGEARTIGGPGREVEVRRKDGSSFPARLSISEGVDDGRRFFTGMLHDITELKRREGRILQLNADLAQRAAQTEAANRELETFSYSVSHDLRAPLHAIQGFVEALIEQHGAALDEQGRHYLERIRAGGERMDTLIEDMLSLSRISRADLIPASVDLSGLALELLAELRESDPARRARFEVQPQMRAYADARLLRIALTNLLGNAWKFSGAREETVIEVGKLDGKGQNSIFFVRDHGAGFDPAHSAKLFGAFQRLHRQSEFPGSGIGLATVRRVVERHGGHVWAESAVNQGATFFFSLPERLRAA